MGSGAVAFYKVGSLSWLSGKKRGNGQFETTGLNLALEARLVLHYLGKGQFFSRNFKLLTRSFF